MPHSHIWWHETAANGHACPWCPLRRRPAQHLKELHHHLMPRSSGVRQRRMAIVILGVHLDIVLRDKELHHHLTVTPRSGSMRQQRTSLAPAVASFPHPAC